LPRALIPRQLLAQQQFGFGAGRRAGARIAGARMDSRCRRPRNEAQPIFASGAADAPAQRDLPRDAVERALHLWRLRARVGQQQRGHDNVSACAAHAPHLVLGEQLAVVL
jgi:hypothetical protein